MLDPLRDIHSAAEDKADGMAPVMRRLRLLSELLGGCTIIVVHHAVKSTKDNAKRRPGQNMRGSGAIHGSVDCGIYVDDSGGDGVTEFTNIVTSQVKGARSAGKYKLALNVTDNEDGEAISARWMFERIGKSTNPIASSPAASTGNTDVTSQLRTDAQLVLDFVRAQLPARLNKTKLCTSKDRPVPEKRCRDAVDRLVATGQLTTTATGEITLPDVLPGQDLGQACQGNEGQA